MGHVDGVVTINLEGKRMSGGCFDAVGLHWFWEVELVVDACGLGVTKIWRWVLGFQS